MNKVKIITDSGADLLPEDIQRHDIDIIPISVFVEGKEYLTGVDITSEEFYELQEKCSEIPKTSLSNPERIYDTFKKYAEQGRDIFMITISSAGSGTYNSARISADMVTEEFPKVKIRLLDSQKFACVYGYGAMQASEMSEEGMGVDEIFDRVKEMMDDFEVHCVPETLKYLEMGGRINKASLVIGTVLDLKPVLAIRNGIMESIGMLRGSKKIAAKLVKKVKESGVSQEGKTLLVVDGHMHETANELVELLKAEFNPKEVIVRPVGPTIAAHIGPVFGVFFHKS